MKVRNFHLVFLFFFLISFSSFSQLPQQNDTINYNQSIEPTPLPTHHKIKIPMGTEFWLCFMTNFTDDPKNKVSAGELILELFITGEENTRVNIEILGLNYRTQLFVRAKTVERIRLPIQAQIKSSQVIEKLAVHITSEKPIFVYGLNRRFQTTDTFLAFPTEVIGTEYRAMCYSVSIESLPLFAIVATEDNTTVTIVPTSPTTLNEANVPFNVTLNRGDVYQVMSKLIPGKNTDLTGTLIKANKKIAVFSGHQCAYVPINIIACNHLVEQMPPVNSWGKHFYIGMLVPRKQYTFRVLANEPKTRVFVDGKFVKELNAGEYFDSVARRPVQVTANKPILVAQYSHGYREDDLSGDPMMLLVSPTQQFLKSYRFATPVDGQWRHMVNVIIPTVGIKSLRLNGVPVDSSLFEQLGISRYSIGYLRIEFGTHYLEADLPFGMYSYGFGYERDAYDAYGNIGGQSFLEYEPATDTLPPLVDAKPTADGYNLIVRDDREDDTGIRGISIIENFGFDVKMPKIDEGAPQVLFKISPIDKNFTSRLSFVATDAALNVSEWTVCYTFDLSTGVSSYQIQKGLTKACKIRPGYQVGIFGISSLGINSSNFSSTGNLISLGNFQNSLGFAGYLGLYFNKFIDENFSISSRISFENYAGEIESPDTIASKIRLEDGSFIFLNEGRSISLQGIFTSLAVLGEYHLRFGLYGFGGLELNAALSKSVRFSRYIINPQNYSYSDGSKKLMDPTIKSVKSLNTFRLNFNFGVGYTYNIIPRLGIFSEVHYKFPLTSLINDGEWFYHRISLIFGLKLKF
ncbi:MAG: outer membrane beta-barrel protein [Ignavibacteria bacterium]|nr:outer membrane beta-barrel protein [Ignavibacteria bacterium]